MSSSFLASAASNCEITPFGMVLPVLLCSAVRAIFPGCTSCRTSYRTKKIKAQANRTNVSAGVRSKTKHGCEHGEPYRSHLPSAPCHCERFIFPQNRLTAPMMNFGFNPLSGNRKRSFPRAFVVTVPRCLKRRGCYLSPVLLPLQNVLHTNSKPFVPTTWSLFE